MIDGIEETVGEGDNQYTGTVKYPALAIPVLDSSLEKLDKYNSEYDSLSTSFFF